MLREFAVAEIPDVEDPKGKVRAKGTDLRERVGRALLASLESELRRRGVESVAALLPGITTAIGSTGASSSSPGSRAACRGWSSRPGSTISPATSASFAGCSGSGGRAVTVRPPGGGRSRSTGGVSAPRCIWSAAGSRSSRSRLGALSIFLAGGDEPIERMVLGVTSPFDEWSQGEIEIRPPLSPDSRKSLETLFPRRDR